ncbi:MAG: phage baseplate assembly protein V [Armatimonadota bacterium]
MSDTLGLIRVGIVSDVDPATVRVKVTFDDLDSDDSTGLLSDWLPVVQHGSMTDSGYWLPRVGSQVMCAMQSNGIEAGYVVGSIYNDEDLPEKSGLGVWYQRFADGTTIEYDPASGVTIDTPLAVVIKGATVEIN